MLDRSFAHLEALAQQVEQDGACSLPGCSVAFEVFVPIMLRAVKRGFVSAEKAQFVWEGLRYGFRCGVNVAEMRGKRKFKNYPTAFAAPSKVSDAIRKRVTNAKTLCLGVFGEGSKHAIPFPAWCIFPMGAVRKSVEDSMRPVDDHTRTLLNFHTDLSNFRFPLNSHKDVAALFHYMCSMAVKDVSDAFPILPLHPSLWPFMLFCWHFVHEEEGRPESSLWCLYVHLFAGFGMASLPGIWKIFFSDVVMGMARSEEVLDLPTPIHVDDVALIGPEGPEVDRQGDALAAFLLVLGILMKAIKTRSAAQRQFYIGLWWDSVTRALELDPDRRAVYLSFFDECLARRAWTLRDAQSLAGRAQRCALTFPPGAACMLAPLYEFMRGLKLPWQKRRTTRAHRDAVRWTAEMLRANEGMGWFSYDQFEWGPFGFTDASSERRYRGGGWVGNDGEYCWFRFTGRHHIDAYEGDAVVSFVEENGHKWRGKRVVIWIDNSAFQLSAKKGWSKADRLNDLLKRLFALSIQFGCVLIFMWISTHANKLADLLSRPDGESAFLNHPDFLWLCWHNGAIPRRNVHCGATRQLGKQFSSRLDGDGPSRSSRVPFQLTVSYSRCSIFDAVPGDPLLQRLDRVMDNRLGRSSLRSVRASLGHWDLVRVRHSWARIIPTDDPERGSKLAVLCLYFVDETELVYDSIANYLWALRSWMKFQRQIDPAYGVVEYSDLLSAVEVLTFMPSESRKEVPGAWIAGAVAHADPTSFRDCRAILLMLLLLFSFARSESPVAKNLTGPDSFDAEKQLCVRDVRVQVVAGKRTGQFRLKGIKQDTLGQRATAQGEGDWVIIGETGDDFCILRWLQRYFSFFQGARAPDAPFFVRDDFETPYLYGGGLDDIRELWSRTPGVTPAMAKTCGLHGLRVSGNTGTTRAFGRWLAKCQGGWDSESQERYDRADKRDVVEIPAGIVRSWQARDPDFDFDAITGVRQQLQDGRVGGPSLSSRPGTTLSVPDPPARTAPQERSVSSPGMARRLRVARVRTGKASESRRASGPPAAAVQDPRLPAGWLRHAYGSRGDSVYYSPSGDRFTSFKRAQAASGTASQVRRPARLSEDVVVQQHPEPIHERTSSRTARQIALARGPLPHWSESVSLETLPRGICGRVIAGGICRRPDGHDLECCTEV